MCHSVCVMWDRVGVVYLSLAQQSPVWRLLLVTIQRFSGESTSRSVATMMTTLVIRALVICVLATSSSCSAILDTFSNVAEAIDVCASLVSTDNAAAGVSAFSDATCATDPKSVGCFADSSCRFCRAWDTAISEGYVACNPGVHEESEGAIESTPLDCASLVSVGDRAIGLSAYFDSACPQGSGGGIGCQSNRCRFCKTPTASTPVAFLPCPTGTTAPTPTTVAPTPTTRAPTPTSTGASSSCDTVVANSRMSFVSFVSESGCNVVAPRMTGCVPRTTCQLCRISKTEQNQFLIMCKVLRDSKTLTATTRSTGDSVETAEGGDDQAKTGASEVYVWLASGAAATAMIVLSLLAIYRSRQRRLDVMDTPRTPVDKALMDPTTVTCISNL